MSRRKKASDLQARLIERVFRGLAAGAAGPTALNLAIYLDMTIRARPASDTPAATASGRAGKVRIDLGDGTTGEIRSNGYGSVLGIATGITVGLAYALLPGTRRPPLAVASAGMAAAAMELGLRLRHCCRVGSLRTRLSRSSLGLSAATHHLRGDWLVTGSNRQSVSRITTVRES